MVSHLGRSRGLLATRANRNRGLRLSGSLLADLMKLHGAAFAKGIELLGVWCHVNSILKVLLVVWVGGGDGLEVTGLNLGLNSDFRFSVNV